MHSGAFKLQHSQPREWESNRIVNGLRWFLLSSACVQGELWILIKHNPLQSSLSAERQTEPKFNSGGARRMKKVNIPTEKAPCEHFKDEASSSRGFLIFYHLKFAYVYAETVQAEVLTTNTKLTPAQY